MFITFFQVSRLYGETVLSNYILAILPDGMLYVLDPDWPLDVSCLGQALEHPDPSIEQWEEPHSEGGTLRTERLGEFGITIRRGIAGFWRDGILIGEAEASQMHMDAAGQGPAACLCFGSAYGLPCVCDEGGRTLWGETFSPETLAMMAILHGVPTLA